MSQDVMKQLRCFAGRKKQTKINKQKTNWNLPGVISHLFDYSGMKVDKNGVTYS